MACDIDQIVDDCPVSAAFYSSFLAGIPLPKRFLPYHAQYIVGQYGKFQHQFIGLELAGWEPLKVHVRLQLAVELFTLPMGVVMPDDFPVCEARVSPPNIGLNVRHKEELPFFVNGALDDLISHADYGMLCDAIPCLVYDLLPVAPDIDSFAIPGMGNVLGVVFYHLQPVLFAFLA